MQIEIKMSVATLEELAELLSGLKSKGLDPHTAVKSPAPAPLPPVQKTKAPEPVKEAKPEPAQKAAKPLTYEEFRDRATRIRAAKPGLDIKPIMARFGIGKLSELDQSRYPLFLDALQSPEAGPDVDDDDLPF